ncbi:MAG TPA: RagB/SusD family nutrient uptake outer membrane protein, partial [Prolixibacteraceae bacterium]|nr:RagB/SusD family nutrient uptake outer membrane protein [Prolixibacteraceae bacterium]
TEVNWTLNQLGVSISADDITKGINEVRSRANLPTYAAVDVTLQTIMAERAYELIFENKLLWDMRRTRKALKDGNGQFAGLVNFVGHQPTNFIYQFSAKHLLSPISATEISNNSKCLQNFGWAPKQAGQN